jgi:hypothetical protein
MLGEFAAPGTRHGSQSRQALPQGVWSYAPESLVVMLRFKFFRFDGAGIFVFLP